MFDTYKTRINGLPCGEETVTIGLGLLPCILAKLFNLFIRYGHVPAAFGISYTVPLLKGSSSSYSKNLTTDDFRGISIVQ